MKIILSILLLVTGMHLSAQSINTDIKFDKDTKQGLMLYLPYSQEVAEGTILTKLKEIGFEPESKGSLFWKQNKVNGFYAFKGVALKGETPQIADLYFKVDSRGKKKDNQSVIYLLTSKGGESFVTEMTDGPTYAAARSFLDGFTSETAIHKHTLDIQAQSETVKKAEKKLADLREEEQDLVKKLSRLQEDLRKNKESQVTQQATIGTEQKKLEELRVRQ